MAFFFFFYVFVTWMQMVNQKIKPDRRTEKLEEKKNQTVCSWDFFGCHRLPIKVIWFFFPLLFLILISF